MNKKILSFGFIIFAEHAVLAMDNFDFPDGGGDRDDFPEARTTPSETPAIDPQVNPAIAHQTKTYLMKADLPFSTLSNLLKRPHPSIFSGPPASKAAKFAGLGFASMVTTRFGYPLVRVKAFSQSPKPEDIDDLE